MGKIIRIKNSDLKDLIPGIRDKLKDGFTLLELMVAIAIVAVLATIGFTLFQSAQAQARDAKRKQDVDAIATVLENKFNAAQGTYTPSIDTDFASGKKPQDPINNAQFEYTGEPAAGASTYVLCAKLEQAGTGNAYNTAGATSLPSAGATRDYYCRRNQQE